MPTKIERERAKFMYEGLVSGSHSGAEKGKMVVVSIFGGRLVIGFRASKAAAERLDCSSTRERQDQSLAILVSSHVISDIYWGSYSKGNVVGDTIAVLHLHLDPISSARAIRLLA